MFELCNLGFFFMQKKLFLDFVIKKLKIFSRFFNLKKNYEKKMNFKCNCGRHFNFLRF